MRMPRGAIAAMTLLTPLALPGAALAQRAGENAVKDAEDAFGSTVGSESAGIYTQDDARGFSPKKAGNVRIDGLYFDQVASLSSRLQQSTAIRVGFAALDYPFPAPTGIADDRLYPMPRETGASLGLHYGPFGGFGGELDFRLPVITDKLALTGGVEYSRSRNSDGSESDSVRAALRPVATFAHTQFAPFLLIGRFPNNRPPPIAVVTGDFLPATPKKRLYLTQSWAQPKFDNITTGATLKSRVAENIVLRGGIFHSGGKRLRNFAELYTLRDASGLSSHRLIADPLQDVHSTSGEGQVVFLSEGGKWKHRVYAGWRARDRLTQSGGSDVLDLGTATWGVPDPEPRRTLHFAPVNASKLWQSSWLLGYVGKIPGLASINLGLQKTRYRARVTNGVTGEVTRTRDDPLLYNATLGIEASRRVSFYLGTQRGLEDSGFAPESASNARAQLPATRTTQYEGGVRWKFHNGQLVVNAFQIAKPYFSFDTARLFTRIGGLRHRGVEASFSGHFGKRLNVLAGAVLIQPRVTGPARAAGLIGRRPAGTPSLSSRIDLNYRTDLFGGLTPTATLTYLGRRAVGDRPVAALGGRQLSLPAITVVDLGLRQQFHLGTLPASLRATVYNVFDRASWDVIAANSLKGRERRRASLSLTADF